MRIVDTSVALKWVVEEEGSDRARALTGELLMAPDLLATELANALWTKSMRGLFDPSQVTLSYGIALSFVSLVSARELVPRALDIGLRLRHPVYDCIFLALAEHYDTRLLTADRRLLAACRLTDFAERLEGL